MILENADREIYQEIQQETDRQEFGLEMIASENYTSRAVMEAQGSVLTNKYAEGYPRKRYYGGCEFVDRVEEIAIERLCKIFGSESANVQPHSGSQANMAVYMTLLKPGDTILGMDLSHGGHLTHGSSVNFSGKIYKSISYGLNPESHRLDFDQIRDLAKANRPNLIVAGASAYPRIIDFKAFADIANEIGVPLVVDMAHIAGLVAANVHPSPIPHATFTTSTTHKTLRGPRGGIILGTTENINKANKTIFPGIQGGPLMHVIAGKAVSFAEALTPEFVEYQKQVVKNAQVLAAELQTRGFDLVTGGTENHLILLDLTHFENGETSGKDAENWLEKAGITVNKNTVPNETRSPFVTSGLRIGTPAITTRGLKESEMKAITEWIEQAIRSKGNEETLLEISNKVKEMCKAYPIYLMRS